MFAMATRQLLVRATWDEEAKVWVATSDDVPGLVAEADDIPALLTKLRVLIPELLDENGYSDGEDVPFKLLSELEDVAHRHP